MTRRIPGSAGDIDFGTIDPGTQVLSQSTADVPYCISRDSSILERTGYVNQAWEIAKSQYVGQAIVEHTEKDFRELVSGLLPMLLMAAGLVLSTTIIGAIVGAFFGGVGAGPGAAAGFSFGMTLLEVLGLGFLMVYLKDRMGAIFQALYDGAEMAWKSCGDTPTLQAAARKMAEAVGLFYAALLQALLLFLGSALASRSLASARHALRESKLFRSSARLEAWINKNFMELYAKHIKKPAPGPLPPLTQSIEEWVLYIQKLDLTTPANKGVLWSRIGPNKAKDLAAARDLVTLEMLLERNGFADGYKEVFGTSFVQRIWTTISERYAGQLSGKVTAFIDDASLSQAIKQSPAVPLKDLKPGEFGMPNAPIITRELMEISQIMESNPRISVVEIRDIGRPDTVIKVMTREMVLQSKSAPLQ